MVIINCMHQASLNRNLKVLGTSLIFIGATRKSIFGSAVSKTLNKAVNFPPTEFRVRLSHE